MAQRVEAKISRSSTGLRVCFRRLHGWNDADPGPFEKAAFSSNESGLLRDWDCLPFLSSHPGRKDEPRGNETSSFDRYHTKGHPLTLGRVVTAVFLRMLKAKGEFDHYSDLFERLAEFEKAVKGKTDPRLLND